MFDKSDLKTEKINGAKHITFHPNTIVYAIPSGSNLAKKIDKAKLGIVWHTSYSGGTFETMKAEFGRDIVNKLKSSPNVWMQDATLPDLSGTATLTKKETLEVQDSYRKIKKNNRKPKQTSQNDHAHQHKRNTA